MSWLSEETKSAANWDRKVTVKQDLDHSHGSVLVTGGVGEKGRQSEKTPVYQSWALAKEETVRADTGQTEQRWWRG